MGASQHVFVEPVGYGFEEEFKQPVKLARVERTEAVRPRPACPTCIRRREKATWRETNSRQMLHHGRQRLNRILRETDELKRRLATCVIELDEHVKRNAEITVTGEHAPIHLRRRLKVGHNEVRNLSKAVDYNEEQLIKQDDFVKQQGEIHRRLTEKANKAKTMVIDCAARRSRKA